MPTTRTRKRRTLRPDIDPAMLAWFKDEAPAPVARYFLSDADLRALWDTHKPAILAAWVETAPGTRPPFWWTYDAPEQRKRLGGKGTPAAEVTALALRLTLGIPDAWVKIDPTDPPTFESEAAFLKRCKLFATGEARRLKARALNPETLPAELWAAHYETLHEEHLMSDLRPKERKAPCPSSKRA